MPDTPFVLVEPFLQDAAPCNLRRVKANPLSIFLLVVSSVVFLHRGCVQHGSFSKPATALHSLSFSWRGIGARHDAIANGRQGVLSMFRWSLPRARTDISNVRTSAADGGAEGAHDEYEVPKSFQRVVAEKAGESVRAVAVVRKEQTLDPGEDEVLVRVLVAGINGGCETFRARGERAFAGLKNACDYALGSEGAGIVLRAGAATDLHPGDAVAFVGSAMAELNIVKASSCHRFGRASDVKPIDFQQATALRISGLTALVALELTGEIKKGQTILITAAAGGTGHFAVQIAKLNGARVIATCSTEDKAQVLRDLGADRVVIYKQEDLSEVLDREFPEGLDLVYEGVGGQLHTTALAHLKKGGSQLQVGYISHYPQAAGEDANPDQGKDLGDAFWGGQRRELDGNRTVYFNVWEGMKKLSLGGSPKVKPLDRLFSLWSEGDLKVLVDSKEFVGLELAGDAVDHMMSGTSVGKVVLNIPAPPSTS